MGKAPKAPTTLDELAVLAELTLTDIQRLTEQDYSLERYDEEYGHDWKHRDQVY